MNTLEEVIFNILKGYFDPERNDNAKQAASELVHIVNRSFIVTSKESAKEVTSTIIAYFDGNGSRDNGKKGHADFLVQAPDGAPFEEKNSSDYKDPGLTNNQLEYCGLINVLAYLNNLAREYDDYFKSASIVIHGDSKLVIEQTLGNWRAKEEHLQLLRNVAKDELARLKKSVKEVKLEWVPSAKNLCDPHA